MIHDAQSLGFVRGMAGAAEFHGMLWGRSSEQWVHKFGNVTMISTIGTFLLRGLSLFLP
jgi:hypothetical protein